VTSNDNPEDKKNSEDFYEKLYRDGWSDEFASRGPTMLLRDHVVLRELARIPSLKEKTILDAGCADLSFLRRLQTQFGTEKLFGFDITAAAFGNAPGREHIETRVLNIERETWEGRLFDVIVCMDVLEHINDDGAALANICRMLAPGGVFIFHVPFSMRYWSIHDEGVGHMRRYEGPELAESLRRAGFGRVRMQTYGYPFMTTYFRLILSRVPPERTQRKKNLLDRIITVILYILFRIDLLVSDASLKRGFALFGDAINGQILDTSK
jgi:SAM-dependent methyltransferase